MCQLAGLPRNELLIHLLREKKLSAAVSKTAPLASSNNLKLIFKKYELFLKA